MTTGKHQVNTAALAGSASLPSARSRPCARGRSMRPSLSFRSTAKSCNPENVTPPCQLCSRTPPAPQPLAVLGTQPSRNSAQPWGSKGPLAACSPLYKTLYKSLAHLLLLGLSPVVG